MSFDYPRLIVSYSLFVSSSSEEKSSFLFMNPVLDKQTSAQETLSTTLKAKLTSEFNKL